jgi:hypothetical protein
VAVPNRDLTIGINGEDTGFGDVCLSAKESASVFEKELNRLDAAQAAVETTQMRATELVGKYAESNDKAGLAAARMGVQAEEASDRAAAAAARAADGAKKLEKGQIDAATAANLDAKAQREVEKAAIASASAQLAAADAAKKQRDAEVEAASASKIATGEMKGGLTSLVAAGLAVSPPLLAAGVAAAAFGALALPAIKSVISAQNGLTSQWSGLDARQKMAAASLADVISTYKSLASSFEPSALTAFNRALETAHSLLPEVGSVARSADGGVQDFLGQIEDFVSGPVTTKFFGFVSGQATPALHELGQTFTQAATLGLNLVENLAPMAHTFLTATNGALGLLNVVNNLDPHIAELAVTALALRGPLTGINSATNAAAAGLGLIGKAQSGAAAEAEGLAGKAGLAEDAEKGLNAATAAGPGLYVAAAAAVAYLAVRFLTARTAGDALVESLRLQYNATGNNITGYQAEAVALNQHLAAANADALVVRGHTEQTKNAGAASAQARTGLTTMTDAQVKLTTEQQRNTVATANIIAGQRYLGQQYGVTAAGAIDLANAAGIDLSKGLSGSSKAALDARAKFKAYEDQVAQASNPTARLTTDMRGAANSALLMADRTNFLTDALNAYYKPASDDFEATTALKQGWIDLAKAMAAAHDNLTGNTAASIQARSAFKSQTDAVSALFTATFNQTGSVTKARAAVASSLPVLYAFAGANKGAREVVDGLATSMGVLPGRSEASRSAFLAAAASMHITRSAALALWAAYEKIPARVSTTISTRGLTEAEYELHHYQASLAQLNSDINHGHATGGLIHRAAGGPIHLADGGPSGYVRGPGTSTSDSIPALLSDGEYVIRASQTAKHRALLDAINLGRDGFAAGGLVGYATGGTVATPALTTPVSGLDLGSIYSSYEQSLNPATAANVTSAAKARANAAYSVARAEEALKKARHSSKKGRAGRVKSAEQTLAHDRKNLADATTNLTSVEKRYQLTKQNPAVALGTALNIGIRDTNAWIANLTTLTNKGFGVLAQQLLANPSADSEAIAAAAVKMSTKQLTTLQGQVVTQQQQQTQLGQLPNLLNVKTALQAGMSTWDQLLAATGLAPNDLAAALKADASDLARTPAGQALLNDLKARGYAGGGEVTGPAGTDAVTARVTAGEYVVRRAMVGPNRQALDAINSGRVRVYASSSGGGGGVGAAPTITNNIYAQPGQSALAVAKNVSHEQAWALKRGGV